MPNVTPKSGLGNAPTTQFLRERRNSSNSITLEAKRPHIDLDMRSISDSQRVKSNCAFLLENVSKDQDKTSFSEKVRAAVEEMAGVKRELTEKHIANMANVLAKTIVQMDDEHIQWTISALDNGDFRKQVEGEMKKLREVPEKLPSVTSSPSDFTLKLGKADEKIRDILEGNGSGDLDEIIGGLYADASTDLQKFKLLLEALEDIEKDFFEELEELQRNFSDTVGILIQISLENATKPFNEIVFETCCRQLRCLQSSSMEGSLVSYTINSFIPEKILPLLGKDKQLELIEKMFAIMDEKT